MDERNSIDSYKILTNCFKNFTGLLAETITRLVTPNVVGSALQETPVDLLDPNSFASKKRRNEQYAIDLRACEKMIVEMREAFNAYIQEKLREAEAAELANEERIRKEKMLAEASSSASITMADTISSQERQKNLDLSARLQKEMTAFMKEINKFIADINDVIGRIKNDIEKRASLHLANLHTMAKMVLLAKYKKNDDDIEIIIGLDKVKVMANLEEMIKAIIKAAYHDPSQSIDSVKDNMQHAVAAFILQQAQRTVNNALPRQITANEAHQAAIGMIDDVWKKIAPAIIQASQVTQLQQHHLAACQQALKVSDGLKEEALLVQKRIQEVNPNKPGAHEALAQCAKDALKYKNELELIVRAIDLPQQHRIINAEEMAGKMVKKALSLLEYKKELAAFVQMAEQQSQQPFRENDAAKRYKAKKAGLSAHPIEEKTSSDDIIDTPQPLATNQPIKPQIKLDKEISQPLTESNAAPLEKYLARKARKAALKAAPVEQPQSEEEPAPADPCNARMKR